jgi:hypothetical protein
MVNYRTLYELPKPFAERQQFFHARFPLFSQVTGGFFLSLPRSHRNLHFLRYFRLRLLCSHCVLTSVNSVLPSLSPFSSLRTSAYSASAFTSIWSGRYLFSSPKLKTENLQLKTDHSPLPQRLQEIRKHPPPRHITERRQLQRIMPHRQLQRPRLRAILLQRPQHLLRQLR